MQILQYTEDTIAFSAEKAIPGPHLQDLSSMYKIQMWPYKKMQSGPIVQDWSFNY